jgi:hypothetical protein
LESEDQIRLTTTDKTDENGRNDPVGAAGYKGHCLTVAYVSSSSRKTVGGGVEPGSTDKAAAASFVASD